MVVKDKISPNYYIPYDMIRDRVLVIRNGIAYSCPNDKIAIRFLTQIPRRKRVSKTNLHKGR